MYNKVKRIVWERILVKVYDVFIWVTYALVIVIITLIGIILLQGTENKYNLLDSLTVLATLIGGIGGAFLGTWLSGKNASKQWEYQKEKENNDKLKFFELFVLNRLEHIFIELSKPNKRIDFLETTNKDIVGEKKVKSINIFKRRQKAIFDLFKEVDKLYFDALDLGKNGIVNWEALNMLRDFKINSQRLKEYEQLKTLVLPSIITEERRREALDYLEEFPDGTDAPFFRNTISFYNVQERKRELIDLIIMDIEQMENKLNKRREDLNSDLYEPEDII